MYVKIISLALIAIIFAAPHAQSQGYRERNEDEELFKEAITLYSKLVADPVKVNDGEIWNTIALAFYNIYLKYPNGSKSENSLFLAGKMYEEMGIRFASEEQLKKSVDYSTEFIKTFPDSKLADDAHIRIARIIEKRDKFRAYLEYEKIIADYPEGDMIYVARNKAEDLSVYKPAERQDKKDVPESVRESALDSLARINRIRHWSSEDYTRVVIDLNKEVSFEPSFLKSDASGGTPTRLYVDIKDTKVDRDLQIEPIKKGLLEEITFGRNTRDTARVVLYMNSFDKYKVFSLYDPFRIVMDIYGDKGGELVAGKERSDAEEILLGLPKYDGKDISNLRGALGLKVRTIVIDPGHGGHDPGAVGPTKLKEKDVNLAVAKALKKKLDLAGSSFGVSRVILTREDDRFIPLEERPAIAKKEKADLFISIHCNAAKNRDARGIETYILSFTDDPQSLAVAARENVSTTKSLSDLEDIVKNYLLSSKLDESKRLGNYVQNSLIEYISGRYSSINNKGVKKAPFIVLIGADIPSVLVETSFITNPEDEKNYRDPDYINSIAEGIFAGVKAYSAEVETAFLAQ